MKKIKHPCQILDTEDETTPRSDDDPKILPSSSHSYLSRTRLRNQVLFSSYLWNCNLSRRMSSFFNLNFFLTHNLIPVDYTKIFTLVLYPHTSTSYVFPSQRQNKFHPHIKEQVKPYLNYLVFR
jgi:hypothetical protein